MMINTALPLNVVEKDRALQVTGEVANRDLIELRWHWTLDESNPDRVSVSVYARQVDVTQKVIYCYAHAYLDDRYSSRGITVSELLARASMTAETAAATEEVAKAHGTTFGEASKKRRNEVRRVRETARETAEQKGTTTLDEISAVGAFHAKAVKAERKRHTEHKRKHPIGYLRMEAKLIKARRLVLDALQTSADYDLGHEERELLQETSDGLRKLLTLFDRAIADRYDQSWKTELRVLEGGRAS